MLGVPREHLQWWCLTAVDCAGLPWDDRCLDFHRSEREGRTASVWQVRQPVYGSSVARWRAYAPWLGTLREALAR